MDLEEEVVEMEEKEHGEAIDEVETLNVQEGEPKVEESGGMTMPLKPLYTSTPLHPGFEDKEAFRLNEVGIKSNKLSNVVVRVKNNVDSFYQCDYKATQKSHLTRHTQAVHEGVTHTCGECNAIFTHKSSLTEHQKSIHEELLHKNKLKCNLCIFETIYKKNLSRHKDRFHKKQL